MKLKPAIRNTLPASKKRGILSASSAAKIRAKANRILGDKDSAAGAAT